jgi:secretion/DNA translocation related TadE-like protein
VFQRRCRAGNGGAVAKRRRPGARPGPDPAADGDSGVATVWAAGAVAVLLVVLLGALHLGSAVVARHRAESAADLAALAAAARAVEGEERACAAARAVAVRAGADVLGCRLVGWDALVEAGTALPFGLPGAEAATGRARAGPAP